MRLAAVVLAIVAASAAAAAAASMPFRTVVRDDGSASAITTRSVDAIRSAREWRAVWSRLNRGVRPQPRRPRVDFSRRTLILVTSGRQNTGGHSVRITNVDERPRRVVVSAEQRAPGASCVTTQALTAPYHVVRVRRTRKPVSVALTRITDDCRR